MGNETNSAVDEVTNTEVENKKENRIFHDGERLRKNPLNSLEEYQKIKKREYCGQIREASKDNKEAHRSDIDGAHGFPSLILTVIFFPILGNTNACTCAIGVEYTFVS